MTFPSLPSDDSVICTSRFPLLCLVYQQLILLFPVVICFTVFSRTDNTVLFKFFCFATTVSWYLYIGHFIDSFTRLLFCFLTLHLSHIMRKPVYAICEQQRRRSACASAQSDQRLCFLCLDSIIPILAIAKISRLSLVSVAEQAGLSLTWSKTRRQVFLMTWLNFDRLWVLWFIYLFILFIQYFKRFTLLR